MMTTLPPPPDELPAYVIEPLKRQSVQRLQKISYWTAQLADAKRNRAEGSNSPQQSARQNKLQQILKERGYDTTPGRYDGVPDHAYLTVKEPKEGYEYIYWQWRSNKKKQAPDKNKMICRLNPDSASSSD